MNYKLIVILSLIFYPFPGKSNNVIDKPNVILINCDDLGYGDLGVYGNILHRTPNIDRLAAEGIKFTDFYVTSGVCSPSRASLLTGSYPRRLNMHEDDREGFNGVLLPVSSRGLNPEEFTLADLFKNSGYATACIGKWHLGDQEQFLPHNYGFDYYFGLPYSNNMNRENIPVPLIENKKVIEAPINQDSLTLRYTIEVMDFIKKNQKENFFVYLAHTMPHRPIYASEKFKGNSNNGIYGDAVEEIDYSTGLITNLLNELNIRENTIIIFTSDNGPEHGEGGTAFPLTGYKASTHEGGMRVPFIISWPNFLESGVISTQLMTTMDLLPTFAKILDKELSDERIIDGRDVVELWINPLKVFDPDYVFYYFMQDQLQCIRKGKYKLHLGLNNKRLFGGKNKMVEVDTALYDLEVDPGELLNIAHEHPEIVESLYRYVPLIVEDIGDREVIGKNQRPAGFVRNPVPMVK